MRPAAIPEADDEIGANAQPRDAGADVPRSCPWWTFIARALSPRQAAADYTVLLKASGLPKETLHRHLETLVRIP